MDRDVNKPLRDDFATKQPATDEDRKASTPSAKEEADDEETAERERQSAALHFDAVYGAVSATLGDRPSLVLDDPQLTTAEREAIRLLYQASSATNEMGTYASALQCKRWMNQALATLQPVVSVALEPELQQVLDDAYSDLQDKIGSLKIEIRSRIQKEAHKGRMRGARKKKGDDDAAPAEGTNLGSIAWELAEAVKKRKRTKLPYDPAANPVIAALDAMQAEAIELGKLALEVSRADKARAGDAGDAAVDQAVEALRSRLVAFLARCGEGQTEPSAPGAHPVLAARFAGLVARAAGEPGATELLGLAADTVAEIHACLDDVDDIVTEAAGGVAPDKKRGVLGALFGRKKS